MKSSRFPFAEICRAHQWKNTPQRAAVYAFVRNNLSHPSVDAVWEEVKRTIPGISRESVYRILNEFAAAGLLCRLDHLESARYDSQTSPHGHFICERCRKIVDFPLSAPLPLPEMFPPEDVRHVELRLSGVCAECRAMDQETSPSGDSVISKNSKEGTRNGTQRKQDCSQPRVRVRR